MRIIISKATTVFFALLSAPALGVGTDSIAVIPEPQQVLRSAGRLLLTSNTCIYTDPASRQTGEFLAARLRKATGCPLEIHEAPVPEAPLANSVLLTTNNFDASLGPEGYKLTVTAGSAVIRAREQAGMFFGVQTLLQLLPPEIFSRTSARDMVWKIPCVEIRDQPRFSWRGLMLDVSRHFFDKGEVEQVLDLMAMYKLNTFHWHLTDDQGWRIEIKKYPKLTKVGAWRNSIGFGLDTRASTAYDSDGRYGGYYTQGDIREVVAYATARHITVVPEIEMLGHSEAALSAYPALSCSGKPGANVYCVGKEDTLEFLQNVINEVAQLFPAKDIHIGGGEVGKGGWKQCALCQARVKREGLKREEELQTYFTRRIEKLVRAAGKTAIGWGEPHRPAATARVMGWMGATREFATHGHDVVMPPFSYCYFDYYQSEEKTTEPRAIGGYLPLDKVYSFEPVPAMLEPQFQTRILGAQGNLWTEYIASLKHAEYMLFPRLLALAEVTWSPKGARHFDDFCQRLETNHERLDLLGVNYHRKTTVTLGRWGPRQVSTNGVVLDWDVTRYVGAPGKHKVHFEYTKGRHGLGIEWAALLQDGREISRDTHAAFTGLFPRQPFYSLVVPIHPPGARFTIQAKVRGAGGTDSKGNVFWTLEPITAAR